MPKFFVRQNQIHGKTISIFGKDVNHIKNVLRLQANDSISICNSDTQENYICRILKICIDSIECIISEKISLQTESNIEITIFQGLPKADKMELIIQKSIELGVEKIVPVQMQRCVVKIDSKDETKKIERWQKIAEVAAKQSGRNIIPTIEKLQNIKKICNLISNYDIVFLAYEKEESNSLKQELKRLNNANKRIGIIIGPEGGLTEEEVKTIQRSGAKVITLGKRILRTETVAFVMASIIMYELGDLGGSYLNEEGRIN